MMYQNVKSRIIPVFYCIHHCCPSILILSIYVCPFLTKIFYYLTVVIVRGYHQWSKAIPVLPVDVHPSFYIFFELSDISIFNITLQNFCCASA